MISFLLYASLTCVKLTEMLTRENNFFVYPGNWILLPILIRYFIHIVNMALLFWQFMICLEIFGYIE